MTGDRCATPIAFADVVDYWGGDLAPADEQRIDAHVFACASCARTLAEGEALARGIADLVRAGRFHALVTETVLNRFARDGLRVRTYSLSPGDVVPCAVWDDDEVMVTRLQVGSLSSYDRISVVTRLASGEELSRTENFTVRPGQTEIIDVFSASLVRQLPATTVRLIVSAAKEGEEHPIGEFVLAHAGSFSHGQRG